VAAWPTETIEQIAATDDLYIAATDDLYIAPYRADGKITGTPTWTWSVVVKVTLRDAR
jgi:hypothetical protein